MVGKITPTVRSSTDYYILFLCICIQTNSQDRITDSSDIFEALLCESDNKRKVISRSVVFIDSFDFYQDPKLLSPYKEKIGSAKSSSATEQVVDLSISHNPLIQYYDRIPYAVVSKYTNVDTLEIRNELSKETDIYWDQIISNCAGVKFTDQFRSYKILRLFSKFRRTIVAAPLLLSSDFALIKKVEFEIGFSRAQWVEEIYLMKRMESSWEKIEVFTMDM